MLSSFVFVGVSAGVVVAVVVDIVVGVVVDIVVDIVFSAVVGAVVVAVVLAVAVVLVLVLILVLVVGPLSPTPSRLFAPYTPTAEPLRSQLLTQLANAECSSSGGSIRDGLSTAFSAASPKSAFSRLDMVLGTVIEAPADSTLTGAQLDTYYDQEVQKIRNGELDKWITGKVLGKIRAFNKDNKDKGIKISCFHTVMINYEILAGILDCLVWSTFSFAFVFLYSYFHIGSVPLTLLGLSHVMISFPVGWFFYRVVLGIKFMGMLNFMSMFIIMGIGADDIFVFIDAWRQAQMEPDIVSGSLMTKMTFAWRRAAIAMLITSLTDAVAFFANVIQLVTVVKVFGIFTGILIAVNYLLVITWFPAVLVLYVRAGYEISCCGTGSCLSSCDTTKDPYLEGDDGPPGGGASKSTGNPAPALTEIMFKDYLAPAFFKDKTRSVFIIFAFLAFGAVAAWQATYLKPSDLDFRASTFPNSTNIMTAINAGEEFPGGRGKITVTVIWGFGTDATAHINRDGIDVNNPLEVPKLVYDSNFAPSKPNHQNVMLQACREFEQSEGVDINAKTKRREVYCWVDHFKAWRLKMNKTFPVREANFIGALANFTGQPNGKRCNATPTTECTAYHETFDPELYLGYPMEPERHWNNYIRWSTPDDDERQVNNEGYDHRTATLRALTIRVNTSVSWQLSAYKLRPIYDKLEKTMNDVNALADAKDFKGMQVMTRWANMRTEEAMLTNSFWGCTISVVGAAIVLVLATQSLTITIAASLSIAIIIITCIALIVVAGWDLGFMESVMIIMCVGFSVDFVVHIGISYMHALHEVGTGSKKEEHKDQFAFVQAALGEIGISVFAAAITTAGASIFLAGTSLIPFQRIGYFISFDIVFSLIVAIFFFSALCR